MSASEGGRVTVRSYHGVVDAVERRIFRVDRWRLPTPHGVSVRAIGYTLACLLALVMASGLPIVGAVLALLPDSVRLVALPLLGGWVLASLRLDGRSPHRALTAALRHLASPRRMAGLRPCPPLGAELSPVEAIQIAPTGDEPQLRPGRVRGPAVISLRYPARVEFDGVGGGAGSDPATRVAHAKRLRVRAIGPRARALPRARTLRVPAGKEVSFE